MRLSVKGLSLMTRPSDTEPRDDWSRSVGTSLWCVVAAFGTYFCMYGFRKPFTAAAYDTPIFAGLDEKTILVIAQVLGYTVSKFLGIKVVSEASPSRRVILLVSLVTVSWLMLMIFAVTPAPWNAIGLFGNGLMLGMVFGLVLGFLEGRRQTEALAAGLCGSFILADGVTKSVGRWLLDIGVTERWMPFAAGLLFMPFLIMFAVMLARSPKPDASDLAARSERKPMDRSLRRGFFRRYAVGLILVIVFYLLVTILRSLRNDFAPELWKSLQGNVKPEMFTYSEMAVGLVVLPLTAAVVMIRDNRKAFFAGLFISAVGGLIGLLSLILYQFEVATAFVFLVLLGIGLYLPYVVVHTILFERLIAATREHANVGYLMYLVDSFGYLGYVAVLLFRGGMNTGANFLTFFLPVCWVGVIGCLVVLWPCWRFFARHPAMTPGKGVA